MTTLMTIPKTQYPSMDDARLAQQARTDPQAFAELYRRREMPGLYQQTGGGQRLWKLRSMVSSYV